MNNADAGLIRCSSTVLVCEGVISRRAFTFLFIFPISVKSVDYERNEVTTLHALLTMVHKRCLSIFEYTV